MKNGLLSSVSQSLCVCMWPVMRVSRLCSDVVQIDSFREDIRRLASVNERQPYVAYMHVTATTFHYAI